MDRLASRPESRHAPRAPGIARRVYAFLTSPRLALAILVAVLGCCVVGVTVYRGERAWALIFSTLWFNALLVLLAVSAGAAFFSRIWRRKLTLVQVGMIVFHLSFVGLLGGVVVNSLFHFKGLLRLTEGETLPNGNLESYDRAEAGRLFDFARLRGETTLLRMHRNYEVDGQNKQAAYEIAVKDGDAQTKGVLYVTRGLEHDGVRFIRAKEGYSVLVAMSERSGREVYAAHVPLQSISDGKGGYTYATGSANEMTTFPFPAAPEQPRFELLVAYRPSAVVEREGEVTFAVAPLGNAAPAGSERTGTVGVGGEFDAGEVKLAPREIRYWVGMDVRYDPGLDAIMYSLWLGLGGMVLTFVGRIKQGVARNGGRRAADEHAAVAVAVRTETP